MSILYVTFFQDEAGQCGRATAEQFVECSGERVKDVMSTDVQVNQSFTVEAVGEVCKVQTIQATVSQLQML